MLTTQYYTPTRIEPMSPKKQAPKRALTVPAPDMARALEIAGQVANGHAARGAVADYLSRKAANTIRHQAADLASFAEFLNRAGETGGIELGAALAEFAARVAAYPEDPLPDIEAWRSITWGLVEAYRNWLVAEGYAVGTINVRLSTVKAYAKLAAKAEVLEATEYAMIRMVEGYRAKEANRINERREITRRGAKKAEPVTITPKQAARLKKQPDTPQGRRDAVIMCLLLDHGLRVGELARLQVTDIDLKVREMHFYRPKVDKEQRHELTADTLCALTAWFESGDAPAAGHLLRNSRKGGALTGPGMNERNITARVRVLGERAGLEGLSAHDCRHYWASYWAKHQDELPRGLLTLQEAGGWSSLAMPRRYVEDAEIANEGMAKQAPSAR
jgi:integrase